MIKLLKISDEVEDDSDVQDNRKRDAEFEFPFMRFVVKGVHTEPGTDTAAEKGNEQKCRFWNAPLVFDGFIFVDSHGCKANDVHH